LFPEKEKVIGVVEVGVSENVSVITGVLNTGEASGIPIIKKLLSLADREFSFFDCPPGSACIVMESVMDADYCILVAEPTIFGVHNLKMVHDLVQLFKIPHGAVLNKCLDGDNPAEEFCMEKGIKILGRIPYDSELGTLNSNAQIAVKENEHYHGLFATLLKTVTKEVGYETTTNP